MMPAKLSAISQEYQAAGALINRLRSLIPASGDKKP